MDEYNIPSSIKELFANGNNSYSIIDHDCERDNIASMRLFLDAVGITDEFIEEDLGTQVTLFDGQIRITIDSGGLGDFFSHGFDVTLQKTESEKDNEK